MEKRGKKIESVIPKQRQQLIKWCGWGYKDSRFVMLNANLIFTGNRYAIGNRTSLPYFRDWVIEEFNVDLADLREPNPLPLKFPEPIIEESFLDQLKENEIDFSLDGEDRLFRCHGQTLRDMFTLRFGEFKRIPDVIVWPNGHDQVLKVIELADRFNIALIPYGGGTSVSGAISCPQNESRTILILDTSQMNRLLWLHEENLVACFEAGVVGQDLERELSKYNLTLGHEPDSHEFSTLGGWVATRASGMKKNTYGNIEDLVVRVKMATCQGTLEKSVSAPRISCGPDLDHLIFGSEGTLGVITEVQVKVRPCPEVKKYGSLVFPNFESGAACLREIARQRCQPSSIRLMDNEQFQFGQCLRPEGSWFSEMGEKAKRTFLTWIKRFKMDKLVVATVVYEGSKESVGWQEKLIDAIAKKFGGFSAGESNGRKGYLLTYVIAYIRDLGLEYSIVSESFETSTTWDRCLSLCCNVKNCIAKACDKRGIKFFHISCRVTQTYDSGCCIYFYFGFNYVGIAKPLETYEEIEDLARDEILASGGSISHHHGVGKIRQKWYPKTVGEVGVDVFRAIKKELDPKNVFAVGNLVSEEQVKAKL